MASVPTSPSLKAAITRTFLWVVATVVVASVSLREWAHRTEVLSAERVMAEAVACALTAPLRVDIRGESHALDDACRRMLAHPMVVGAWIFDELDQPAGFALQTKLDPLPFEQRRIEPGASRPTEILMGHPPRAARGWLIDLPLPACDSTGTTARNAKAASAATRPGAAATRPSVARSTTASAARGAAALARPGVPANGHLRLLLRPMLRPPPWHSRLWVSCASLLAIGAIGSAIGSRQLFYEILSPLTRLGALALRDEQDARPAMQTTQPGELHEIAQALEALRADRNEWKARAQHVARTVNSRVAERTQAILRDLQRVKREMTTDPMTKLNNRRVLQDQFEAIFTSQRDARQNLTVVMLDIDHFKTLNDTLGHRAGDELLIFTGELIRGSLRSNDVAVRYGGDEFVLILPSVGASEGEAVARRLLALFAQHAMLLTNLPKRPSLSAGVASLWEHSPRTAAELLEFADRALYAGKQGGRSLVCAFDPRMGPVRQGRSPQPLTRTAPAATVAPAASPRA